MSQPFLDLGARQNAEVYEIVPVHVLEWWLAVAHKARGQLLAVLTKLPRQSQFRTRCQVDRHLHHGAEVRYIDVVKLLLGGERRLVGGKQIVHRGFGWRRPLAGSEVGDDSVT